MQTPDRIIHRINLIPIFEPHWKRRRYDVYHPYYIERPFRQDDIPKVRAELTRSYLAKKRGLPQDLVRYVGSIDTNLELEPTEVIAGLCKEVDREYERINSVGDLFYTCGYLLRLVDLDLGILEWKLGWPLPYLPDVPNDTDIEVLRLSEPLPELLHNLIGSVWSNQDGLLPRLTKRHIRLMAPSDKQDFVDSMLDPKFGKTMAPGSIGALRELWHCRRGSDLIAKYCSDHPDLIPDVSYILGINREELTSGATAYALCGDCPRFRQ